VEFIDRGEKEVAAMDVDRTSCHACPEPDPTRKNKRGPRGTHIYRGGKELAAMHAVEDEGDADNLSGRLDVRV
jgi:hypothetical protein